MIVPIGHTRDAGKAIGIDRVHRNRHAGEPRLFQRLRHVGQQMPIRSKGNVKRLDVVEARPIAPAGITSAAIGVVEGRGFSRAAKALPENGL